MAYDHHPSCAAKNVADLEVMHVCVQPLAAIQKICAPEDRTLYET
jgi:hypothetical protein